MMKSSDTNDDNLYKIANALIQNTSPSSLLPEDLLTEPQLRYKLEDFMTNRQIDILFKRMNQEKLGKTEAEYYSRTIKKRLKYLYTILPWLLQIKEKL